MKITDFVLKHDSFSPIYTQFLIIGRSNCTPLVALLVIAVGVLLMKLTRAGGRELVPQDTHEVLGAPT